MSSHNGFFLPSIIDLIEINKIACVKDVVVLFDSKSTFSLHVDYFIAKSIAIYIIQRNSAEFNDLGTILWVYNS